MKVLVFIFTLYVAALSVYPCYEDDCLDELSMASSTDQDEHENEDEDPCAPFCIRACCSIHVYYASPFECVSVFQKSIAENSTYTVKPIPQVVISIWQPPKLV